MGSPPLGPRIFDKFSDIFFFGSQTMWIMKFLHCQRVVLPGVCTIATLEEENVILKSCMGVTGTLRIRDSI